MLVCVEGRSKLVIINIADRAAIAIIDNPSGSSIPFCIMKHPFYDLGGVPYVLLKDERMISLIDVTMRKAIPLIEARNDMDHLNNNNFGIRVVDKVEKSLKGVVMSDIINGNGLVGKNTWVYSLNVTRNG